MVDVERRFSSLAWVRVVVKRKNKMLMISKSLMATRSDGDV